MNKGSNIGIETGYPTYMPDWTYTVLNNVVGFSVINQREMWYKVSGKTVYFIIRVYGISNEINFRFTLPNNLPVEIYDSAATIVSILGINNGNRVLSARVDYGRTAGGANNFGFTCYASSAGGNWGTSLNKGISMNGFFETN